MRVNIVLCILSGLVVGISSQNQTTNLPEQSTTGNIEVTNKPCVTSRGDAGNCVGRNRCEYGTQFIDFTLYVPHGYIRQCFEDDVCCPPNFVIPEPERLFTPTDNDYDFDADD